MNVHELFGFVAQLRGFAGESMIDSLFQLRHTLKTAYRQLVLLDIVPDRLDPRLFRAVRCQRHHMDPRCRPLLLLCSHSLTLVHRVVVPVDCTPFTRPECVKPRGSTPLSVNQI